MAYNYEYPYTDPGMYNDDWLLKKMKEIIAEWEAMQVKFTTLEEYVKNYFANLDVQDEINNKIDAMISNGTMASLINGNSGPFQFYQPAITLGGATCVNSKDIYGNDFLTAIVQNLYCPSTPISTPNATLMAPDSTSFYHVLQNYLAANPTKTIRYCFVMPERSDFIGYSLSQIALAVRDLTTLLAPYKAVLILLHPPLHSFSYSTEEQQIITKFRNLEGINSQKLYVGPLLFYSSAEWLDSNNYMSAPSVSSYALYIQNLFYPNGAKPIGGLAINGPGYNGILKALSYGMKSTEFSFYCGVTSDVNITVPFNIAYVPGSVYLPAQNFNGNHASLVVSSNMVRLNAGVGDYTGTIVLHEE